jgi:CIC family chloride channel protein
MTAEKRRGVRGIPWLYGFRLDWQENIRLNLLALVVGVASGFVAIGFRYLILWIQNLTLFGSVSMSRSDPATHTLGGWIVLAPAAGGLLVGLMTVYLASEARGHGVPEVMEAIALHGGRLRTRLVGVKALASAVTIGTGGSAGREGPIVQIGSSLGSTIARAFQLPASMTKVLVACGASGGIAATFNTPIGGVLFSIELILLELKTRSFVPLVIASVFATIVSRIFLGQYPAFIVPQYGFAHTVELLFYLILGVLAGVVAVAMVFVLYKAEDLFERLPGPPYLRPVAGGLLLGSIAFFFPHVLGVGYETIDAVLHEGHVGHMLLVLMALKIVALSLTLGSGGSGGVFAPSLFVGACLGGAFGALVHHLFPASTATYGAYALVGMAAVFSGAGRATLTSIIILFEMTRDYRVILPLMFACVVADLVAWILHPDSIYTAKLSRRGVRVVQDMEVDLLSRMYVKDVMERGVETVEETATVREAHDKALDSERRALPVVNARQELVGIITQTDLGRAVEADETDQPVSAYATRDVITTYPEETLAEAVIKFSEANQIPVVERWNRRSLVGLLTRKDLLKLRGPDAGRQAG